MQNSLGNVLPQDFLAASNFLWFYKEHVQEEQENPVRAKVGKEFEIS